MPQDTHNPTHTCRSCRYYVPRAYRVGILHTNGKGWKTVFEMDCEKHSPYVRELRACPVYEREPGADDA